MFELPVTALSCDENPTIVSQELEDIANFHSVQPIGDLMENQKPYTRSHITVELTRRRASKHPSPDHAS